MEALKSWLVQNKGTVDIVLLQELFLFRSAFKTHGQHLRSCLESSGLQAIPCLPPSILYQDSGLVCLIKGSGRKVKEFCWRFPTDVCTCKGAVCVLLDTSPQLCVINVHLDAHFAWRRKNQIGELTQWIRKEVSDRREGAMPCIVAGDFNVSVASEEGSFLLSVFASVGFRETFPELQEVTHKRANARLDYIFVNEQLTVVDSKLMQITTAVADTLKGQGGSTGEGSSRDDTCSSNSRQDISDHFGLFITLEL